MFGWEFSRYKIALYKHPSFSLFLKVRNTFLSKDFLMLRCRTSPTNYKICKALACHVTGLNRYNTLSPL